MNKDKIIKINAIQSLGETGNIKAAQPLIELYKNSNDSEVKSHIAFALGEIKDTLSIQALIPYSKNTPWFVQRAIAKAFVKSGTSVYLKKIVSTENNPETICIAIQALAASNNFQDCKLLLKFGVDENADIRKAAIWALGEIKYSIAIHLLIDKMLNDDKIIQHEAAKSLVKIGEPAIKSLLEAIENPSSFQSRLNKSPQPSEPLGKNQLFNLLLSAVSAESEFDYIIYTLSRIGKPAIIPLIQAEAKLKGSMAVHRIYRAIENIRDEDAVEDLNNALKNAEWILLEESITKALDYINNKKSVEDVLISKTESLNIDSKKKGYDGFENFRDNERDSTLLTALENNVEKIILEEYSFYIFKGIPGSESILEYILESGGNLEMAVDLYFSNNEELKKAAVAWLNQNGFLLPKSSKSQKYIKWGSYISL